MGNKLNLCKRRSRKKRYQVLRKNLSAPASKKIDGSSDEINQCVSLPNEDHLDDLPDEVDIQEEAINFQDMEIDFVLDDSDLCGIGVLPKTPPKRLSSNDGATLPESPPEFESPPVKLFRNNNSKNYSRIDISTNIVQDEVRKVKYN